MVKRTMGSKNLKTVESYYEMTGWDPETGVPRRRKLAELDLDWLCS
jgi:aldehyde:ferredoxin oxidoreductase